MRRILLVVVAAALIAAMLVLTSGGTAIGQSFCKAKAGLIVVAIPQGEDFFPGFPEEGVLCGEEGLTEGCLASDFEAAYCSEFDFEDE